MKTLTLTLKQHTPLLHFQDEQRTASLRVTEIKPKLDKWLLLQMDEAKSKAWSVSTPVSAGKSNKSLKYKMRVRDSGLTALDLDNPRPSIPMFFGRGKRAFFTNNSLIIEIMSHYDGLIELIAEQAPLFFLTTNFGTRQSKGYGGFEVTKIEVTKIEVTEIEVTEIKVGKEQLTLNPTAEKFFENNSDLIRFEINATDWQSAFDQIDLFYKSVRGGINYSGKFYCKPILFFFAKKYNWQWEKKSIKEKFLTESVSFRRLDSSNGDGEFDGYGLKWQQEEYKDDREGPVIYSSDQRALIRDLLGLSTNSNWYTYGIKVYKKYKGTDRVTRIPSPFYFKVFASGPDKYRVILMRNNELIDEIVERVKENFEITIKNVKWKNNTDRKSAEKLELCFPTLKGDLKSVYEDLYSFIKNFSWEDFHTAKSCQILKALYDSKSKFNEEVNGK